MRFTRLRLQDRLADAMRMGAYTRAQRLNAPAELLPS